MDLQVNSCTSSIIPDKLVQSMQSAHISGRRDIPLPVLRCLRGTIVCLVPWLKSA